MRKLLFVFVAACMSGTVFADNHEAKEVDEKLSSLINEVVQAYGGDALTNITGYQISEQFLSLAVGQSHTPDLMETAVSSQVLNFDMANERSAYDTWFKGRGGGFQGSVISDGEKGSTLNHQAQRIGEAGSPDPYVFAGGTMRTSDAILVYELSKSVDKATLGEDDNYQNQNHHVVTLPFPSSPDLNLYINSKTKLVSKMVRNNPQLGALTYVFSDYQKNNGITYAANTMFSIAGIPNLISKQRKITFNPSFDAATFLVPENYQAEAERIDTSEYRATQISDRVTHVGQGNAYSLFVDAGDFIVATGGYAGLQNRIDHFRKETNNYKPLAYQVVTHHHSDHIGGLAEAVAAGAELITVAENMNAITDGVNPPPTAANIRLMSKRMTLGSGRSRAELYEISTSHSDGYILVYSPATKTIFSADHVGSPFVSGTPVATEATVTMLAAIDDLGIDVDSIATAHSARIFTIKEMRDSVKAFTPNSCLGNRPVCALLN